MEDSSFSLCFWPQNTIRDTDASGQAGKHQSGSSHPYRRKRADQKQQNSHNRFGESPFAEGA
jgi:hypothetical protein